MKGRKTPPAKEEAVYAHYFLSQNFSETGQHFKMPRMTVVQIVSRLKTDDLVSIRRSIRADLATQFLGQINPLISVLKPRNCGTEHSSLAVDAAKVLDVLVRAVIAIDPDIEDANSVVPTEIHVHTHMPPPPELQCQLAPMTETTTTTADKLS